MSPLVADAALVANATTPVVKPLITMVPALVIFFVFFYAVNSLVFFAGSRILKYRFTWPLATATVGAAAAMTFLALLLSFAFTDKTIFTFPLTFAIMVSSNFALLKFLLKMERNESIILGIILSIISNPILWLVALT